ncbi:MAG: DNA-processing protein DprA [Desulfatitalea sp.]|nr:DNA-processing protein DprA [Desulfatitalea sp.]
MKHLVPWLTLKSVAGIGNLLFNRLIQHFQTPERVLAAPVSELLQVEGITPKLANAIWRQRPSEWVQNEIEQVCQKGYALITMGDAHYPALLRQIPDPPPLLYVHGRLEPDHCPIAVVGSRNASAYGRTTTHRLCTALALRGATVVSGMARGIDTAAHRGTLDGGGRTVAVLGSGLNRIYPTENRKLYLEIAETGAVITEFSLDAAPEGHHFPMRNRIISGMSVGTVVVEAARKSGSLITARLAAEQNREVFAVPGSIHSATARGTHDLIKQGAKLVENVDDILEEIAPQLVGDAFPSSPARPWPSLSAAEQALLAIIGADPVHIDDLARQSDNAIGTLTDTLTRLEIKGVIIQEPGKRFLRHTDFFE